MSKVRTITVGRVIQWILAIIFALGSISALFQLKIIVFMLIAGLAFMWTSYFDKLTEEKNQFRLSFWVKFIIMWVVLAILSFGGFYR